MGTLEAFLSLGSLLYSRPSVDLTRLLALRLARDIRLRPAPRGSSSVVTTLPCALVGFWWPWPEPDACARWRLCVGPPGPEAVYFALPRGGERDACCYCNWFVRRITGSFAWFRILSSRVWLMSW